MFDTTYIIDLINADKEAVKKAEEIDSHGTTPALSVISAHEYLLGVHIRYQNDKPLLRSKLAEARQELNSFEVLPLTQEIVETSSRIQAELVRGGGTIGINDIYIAATALFFNIKVVTRDLSHFKRIKELKTGTY